MRTSRKGVSISTGRVTPGVVLRLRERRALLSLPPFLALLFWANEGIFGMPQCAMAGACYNAQRRRVVGCSGTRGVMNGGLRISPDAGFLKDEAPSSIAGSYQSSLAISAG